MKCLIAILVAVVLINAAFEQTEKPTVNVVADSFEL